MLNIIQKQCAIIDKNTNIYQHTRTLHFTDGELQDILENYNYVESSFSPNNGLWKYNGNDFVEILEGVFYQKTDANEFSTIEKDKASEYTEIPPLPKYTDGTTQVFNDVLNTWEYTFKGPELLAEEKAKEFEIAKNQKFAELDTAFTNSKRIVIKEKDIEFPIRNVDKQRKEFFKILEIAKKTDSNQKSTEFYFDYEIEIDKKYEIATVPIILKKVYEMYFNNVKSTGFDENIRRRNKDKYLFYQKQINKATKLEELDFQFDFINPNGIDIIFEDVANAILIDENIDVGIKQLVENAMQNGFIQITDI